jgi:hypothetical protein
MEKPIIDDEFRRLLPELAPEELAELEESVLEEGIRDPLILWQETGILLDGHNRLSIAQKHGLPYQTQELAFADREAARDWIINNQLGRRNLTPGAFALLLGMKYNREKQQGKRTDLTSGQNDQKSQAQQTSKRLAEEQCAQPQPSVRHGRSPSSFAHTSRTRSSQLVPAGRYTSRPVIRDSQGECTAPDLRARTRPAIRSMRPRRLVIADPLLEFLDSRDQVSSDGRSE